MHVLVTFAVDAEFAPWRKLRHLREIKIGDLRLNQAQIGRAMVDFVVTGMGAENASRTANAVMTQPYAICIAAGFAGALQPDYPVGTVVVAEAVQKLGDSKTLTGSRNLAHAARDDGAKMIRLLTSDHVVRTGRKGAACASRGCRRHGE